MSNDPNDGLTPEQAQALLTQALQAESTTKTAASWPQVAGLLSLGAASSLALPAIVYAPSNLLALPMALMMLWIAASFAFMFTFSRSVKRGFGKRWISTIIIWGVLWVASILGTSTWFAGQTWFLIAACIALTAATMIGAWVEAKR